MWCSNPDCIDAGKSVDSSGGALRCARCGSLLLEGAPHGISRGDEVDYREFVPVRTIGNAALVPLARSLLDSAGIRHFIRNERVQELIGWGRVATGYNIAVGTPLVTVEPSRADEARKLLAKLDDPAAPSLDIADAWKEVAPADGGEPAPPVGAREKARSRVSYWIAIALGVLALLIGWSWLTSTPLVRGLILGTTDVVLEADVDSALREELELGKARLAHALETRGVSPGSIDAGTGAAIEVVGVRPGDAKNVVSILGDLFPSWSREAAGPGSWRVEMTPGVKETVIRRALDDARTDLRQRLGASLVDVEESPSGKLRLHVRVPGIRDLAGARSLFEQPAMLEMKRVRYPEGTDAPGTWFPQETAVGTVALFGGRLPPDVELIAQRQEGVDIYWPVSRVSIVVGRDLVRAYVTTSEWGDPAISFLLSQEAGERLETATRTMIGRKMAIVLRTEEGSRVMSAPVIRGVIRDSGIVKGGFTAESARSLAARLGAGSRPLFLTPVETSTGR